MLPGELALYSFKQANEQNTHPHSLETAHLQPQGWVCHKTLRRTDHCSHTQVQTHTSQLPS